MNRNDLYHSFNAIDDDILERSETAQHTRKKPTWLKWGTIAACLCLVAALAVLRYPAESPYTADTGSEGCGLPSITVNGVNVSLINTFLPILTAAVRSADVIAVYANA